MVGIVFLPKLIQRGDRINKTDMADCLGKVPEHEFVFWIIFLAEQTQRV